MEKCVLSSEQIKYYATLAYYHNREAEEILLESLLPYVENIAQSVLNNLQQYSILIDIDDLIQEGLIGLSSALHSNDPTQHNRFYTNISLTIRTKIRNYILKKTHAEKEDIISCCDLHSCTQIVDSKCFEEQIIFSVLIQRLCETNILTENEKKFLNFRYKYNFILSDIAREFHVTRSRIGQIEQRVLSKLKNYLILNEILEIKDFKAYEKEYFKNLSDLDQLRYIVSQIVLNNKDFSSLCVDLELNKEQIKIKLNNKKKLIDPILYSKLVALNIEIPISIDDEYEIYKFVSQKKPKVINDNFSVKYSSKVFSDGMIIDIACEIISGKLLKDICQLYNLDSEKVIKALQERLHSLSINLYHQLFELGYVKYKRKPLSVNNKKISLNELLYIANQIVKKGKLLSELCTLFKLDIDTVNNQLKERLPNLSSYLYDELVSLGYITFGIQKKFGAK